MCLLAGPLWSTQVLFQGRHLGFEQDTTLWDTPVCPLVSFSVHLAHRGLADLWSESASRRLLPRLSYGIAPAFTQCRADVIEVGGLLQNLVSGSLIGLLAHEWAAALLHPGREEGE